MFYFSFFVNSKPYTLNAKKTDEIDIHRSALARIFKNISYINQPIEVINLDIFCDALMLRIPLSWALTCLTLAPILIGLAQF